MARSALAVSLIVAMSSCTSVNLTGESRLPYLTDPRLFTSADSAILTSKERKALEIVRKQLEQFHGHPVRGEFAIAQCLTGYQINFRRLQYPIEAGTAVREVEAHVHSILECVDGYRPIAEGFGNAWVDQELRVLRMHVGP